MSLALLACHVLAQGPVVPASSPAQTMKSLQELWDKLGILQTTVRAQQEQINALQQENTLLLEAQGIGLPWQIRTVDSAGNVGKWTSLAFTRAGQAGISYYDESNGDLKFALLTGSKWQISTVDSDGNVGRHTSLAFTPEDQPAIGLRRNSRDTLCRV